MSCSALHAEDLCPDVVKETIQELNVCSVCDDFVSFAGFSLLKKVLKVEDPYLEWHSSRQSANVPFKYPKILCVYFVPVALRF